MGLRERASRFWREYTRMRTAILFLIGIALIVLVGSFVPQQETSQQAKVDEFLLAHQNLDALTSHLGFPLTQVFVSPLFYVLLGSLYIALASCVLRRGTALVRRTLRGHPRTPQYWGEWGSWLFHTSFFLLLIAVVWGKATGFEGIVTVTEGDRVTEARTGFDTLREGFLFDGHHAGYQVALNRFHAGYAANGAPSDFVSNVTVYDQGRAVETRDIRVNDFLGYRDVDFYQQDYGWAPHLVVQNPAGRVVYDGRVQLFGGDKSAQTGVLKVPDFGYTLPGASRPVQIGAKLVAFPDARTRQQIGPGGGAGYGPGGQEARNPVLLVQLYVGDLGLDTGRPQDVTQLDTRAMSPYFQDGRSLPVPLAGSLRLPLAGTDCAGAASGCFTVSFPELRQYSLFHVKKDQGVPLVYASFGMVMIGLLSKLYLRPLLEARRRRGDRPGSGDGAEPVPVPASDYAWLASTTAGSAAETPVSSGGR
ncbi:MAG: cytochrome c biosis protein [Chloroflexota bacterium]|jgi:cytochrome c biogenesis protein|nr:cytochrome c biosis protein [Chloroflexota bacterium]